MRFFNVLADPILLVWILHVHVLDADVITIRVAKHVDDFTKRRTLYTTKSACIKLTIKIPDREVVVRRIKLRIIVCLVTKRIDARKKVTTHTICVDHLDDATFLVDDFRLIMLQEWVNTLFDRPAKWLERDIECCIDLIVEAVIAEQQHDELGLRWPAAVSPFDVHVVIANKDAEARAGAEELAAELDRLGFEVLLDDRTVSPGVKFKDAELLGMPWIVVLGRGWADGTVELRNRFTGETREVAVGTAVADLAAALADV